MRWTHAPLTIAAATLLVAGLPAADAHAAACPA